MKSNSGKGKSVLYRHGDVLVSGVETIPTEAVRRPHLVLAEGEMTGHSHRIGEAGSAQLYQLEGVMYLRIFGPLGHVGSPGTRPNFAAPGRLSRVAAA